MNISLPDEQVVMLEAMQILSRTMTPSQMVILISHWWRDGGDTLKYREGLFVNETVESLAQKIRAFEQKGPQ